MKPLDKLSAWVKSDALTRIEMCRVMLGLHGFLTRAEEQKVEKRIKAWIERNQLTPVSVPLVARKRTRKGK